jgi:hypothetical protein
MKSDSHSTRGKRRGSAARGTPAVAPAASGPDAYFSLTSVPGAGSTRAWIVDGLSIGLDVHEPLHRFDANVHLPTRERGVTSANRVGEPIATVRMKWRAVEGSADGPAAPATGLRTDASQHLAIGDGVIAFRNRGQASIGFSGSGRTYPGTTDGEARLFFAGTARILDGAGAMTGARGTLLISGEITAASSVALTVVGRIDAGGPVASDDTLAPLVELAADAPATVLTLVGESEGPRGERLRAARIGNDLGAGSTLRSLMRLGTRVGAARVTAPDSRVLTFTDPAGVRIGSITAVGLEGDGVLAGVATHGTGALTGAGGTLTMETSVDAAEMATTIYVLRLADPKGRFRAAYGDSYRAAPLPPAVEGPPEPAPADSLAFVDGPGGYMSAGDLAILRHAERSLADGMELAAWWDGRDRTHSYAETFEIARDYPDAGRSFGFFDTATVANASMPAMGMVHEMFYDRQKTDNLGAVRDQLKEFVLKYFMRLSRFGRRDAAADAADQRREAFGYRQLYYKRRDSSQIGKFLGEARSAIVDLREIGTAYDWIVLEMDLFNFNLSLAPFGSNAPRLQLPLSESTYLVLGPPFIRNQDDPEPGVLGQYGFGYAFVPYSPGGPGLIAYSPGHLAAAIQQIDFTLMADGEIRVRAAFVVNRPSRIAQFDFDPIVWGFKLADLMTFGAASRVMSPVREIAGSLPLRVSGLDPISTYLWMANAITNGMAGRRLGHSKAVLEKQLLAQHFRQHHALLTSSLLVWRMVADWMDEARVPAFGGVGGV